MKWTKEDLCFSVIDSLDQLMIAEDDPSRGYYIFVAGISASLIQKFGRGPPRDRKNLSADSKTNSLERIVSQRLMICG